MLTLVKGEKRFIYLRPGGWLRCVGDGQFSASTDETFNREFALIPDASEVQQTSFAAMYEMVERMNEAKPVSAGKPNVLYKILGKLRGKEK